MHRLFLRLHQQSRAKKYRLFTENIRPTAQMRILNIGVTGTTTGLEMQFEASYPWPEQVVGGGPNMPELLDYKRSFPHTQTISFDGCALPFRTRGFDVVYSNAVIEHLPPEQQSLFAGEIQRVGRGWFVATPNRLFPIEPHYRLPLVQFLSQENQQSVARKFGKVPYPVLNLLNRSQMRSLFPTSRIIGCRVTLYPETLVAVHAPS